MANGEQGQSDAIYNDLMGKLGAPPPEPPIDLPGVPDEDEDISVPGAQGPPSGLGESDAIYNDLMGKLGGGPDKERELRTQHFGDVGDPIVPKEMRRNARSHVSAITDREELLKALPDELSEKASPELLEDVDWQSDPEEFKRAHRNMVRDYERARSKEDKALVMLNWSQRWNPDLVKGAEEDVGVFMRTGMSALTSLADVVMWVDSWSGRPIRAGLKSVWESRRNDLQGNDAYTFAEMQEALSRNYESSDASFEDGNATARAVAKWTQAVVGAPFAMAQGALTGKGVTTQEWLNQVETQTNMMFDSAEKGLGWGLQSAWGLIPGGRTYSEVAEARDTGGAERWGHNFMGFVGLVLTDPITFLKLPLAAKHAGVSMSNTAKALPEDAIAAYMAKNVKQLKEQNRIASGLSEGVDEIDDAIITTMARERATAEVNYMVIDAADTGFRKGVDVHGWGAVELLKELRAGYAQTDPAHWLAKFPGKGEEWAAKAAGEFQLSTLHGGLIDNILEQSGLAKTLPTNATHTTKMEEAWAWLAKEQVKRNKLFEMNIKLTGEINPTTGKEVKEAIISWVDPRKTLKADGNMGFKWTPDSAIPEPSLAGRIGAGIETGMVEGARWTGRELKELGIVGAPRTAEQLAKAEAKAMSSAFKRTRMFAKSDNRRVRWGMAAMGHMKGMDQGRMTVESIIGLQKAQPYFKKVGANWQPMKPMHVAKWRKFERGELQDQARRTLNRQQLANHFDEINQITKDPEVLRLAMVYKELGRHIPTTTEHIKALAWMDKLKRGLDDIEAGRLDDLPMDVRQGLLEANKLEESAELMGSVIKGLQELMAIAKGPERTKAISDFRNLLSTTKDVLKMVLLDDFKIKNEMATMLEVSPDVAKLANLRKIKAELDGLAEKGGMTEASSLERVLEQIKEIRRIQEGGLAAAKGEVSSLAKTEVQFLEELRASGFMPKGTRQDWATHKDWIHGRVREILSRTGVAEWEAQGEAVMSVMNARAKTWAFWSKLPDDASDAFFVKYSKEIEENVTGVAVEAMPIKGGTDEAATLLAEEGKHIVSAFQSRTFQGMIKGVGRVFTKDLPAKDLEIASDWIRREIGEAGFKASGEWSEAGQSMWAQGFANWTKTGRVTNHGLREVFAKFKEWIFRIYRAVSGQKEYKFKMSPEVEDIFDRLLSKEAYHKTHPMAQEFEMAYGNYMKSYGGDISVLGKAMLNEVLDSMMTAAKYAPHQIQRTHRMLFSKDKQESVEALKFIREQVSDRLSGRFAPPREKFSIKAPEFKPNKTSFRNAIADSLQDHAGLTADEAKALVRRDDFDEIVAGSVPMAARVIEDVSGVAKLPAARKYKVYEMHWQNLVLGFAKKFVDIHPERAPGYPRMGYRIPERAVVDIVKNYEEAAKGWGSMLERTDGGLGVSVAKAGVRSDDAFRVKYYKATKQLLTAAGIKDAENLSRRILEVGPRASEYQEVLEAAEKAIARLKTDPVERRAALETEVRALDGGLGSLKGQLNDALDEVAAAKAGKPAAAAEEVAEVVDDLSPADLKEVDEVSGWSEVSAGEMEAISSEKAFTEHIVRLLRENGVPKAEARKLVKGKNNDLRMAKDDIRLDYEDEWKDWVSDFPKGERPSKQQWYLEYIDDIFYKVDEAYEGRRLPLYEGRRAAPEPAAAGAPKPAAGFDYPDHVDPFYKRVHEKNEGVFYRGSGGSKGTGVSKIGDGLYLTHDKGMAKAFARIGGGKEVISYELPPGIRLLNEDSAIMAEIKEGLGVDPWFYSSDPDFVRNLTNAIKERGYDGAISSDKATGLVIFDESLAKRTDAPKAPAAAEALSEHELKAIERGWNPAEWTDKASKEAFKTHSFLSTLVGPEGISRQKISAAKKAITKRLAAKGYKYEDMLDPSGWIEQQRAADMLGIGTEWQWMQGGDWIAPEWMSAMEKRANILGVDLPSRGSKGTKAYAESIIKAVEAPKPAAAAPVEVSQELLKQSGAYELAMNLPKYTDAAGGYGPVANELAALGTAEPRRVIPALKKMVENVLRRDHGVKPGAARRLIKDEGANWSTRTTGDVAASVAREAVEQTDEWMSREIAMLKAGVKPDDIAFDLKKVTDYLEGKGGIPKGQAQDILAADKNVQKFKEQIARLEARRDSANDELGALAVGPDEAALAEAAEVSATRNPADEKLIAEAATETGWIDGEIAKLEALIGGAWQESRSGAEKLAKEAAEKDLSALATLKGQTPSGKESWAIDEIVAAGEGPITDSLERVQKKIAEGLMKGQPGKRGDMTASPSVIPKQLSKSMQEKIDAIPGAKEEMLDIAKKMNWNLKDSGEIWEHIVKYRGTARAAGDLAEAKRAVALRAMFDWEAVQKFNRWSTQDKRIVFSMLRDKRKYGVPPGASAEVKRLANELGLVGKEDVMVHLTGKNVSKRYGKDVESKKVRAGDHFSDDEMLRALEVAKVMDEFLEEKLKKLQANGRLLTMRDKKIGKEIDAIARKLSGKDEMKGSETKEALEKELAKLRPKEFRPWTKDEFLHRTNVASYLPHMMKTAARRHIEGLRGGLLPANYKTGFEIMRTRAGILDDVNDVYRDELAEQMLYHDATSLQAGGPQFESLFAGGWSGEFPYARGQEELSAIYNAASKGKLKEFFTSNGRGAEWDGMIKAKRSQAKLDDIFEFFETDYVTLIKRYSESIDKAVADQVFIDDILRMFPIGKEMGRDVRFIDNPDLAREFGYVKLDKRDYIESLGRMKMPKGLDGRVEQLINTRLQANVEIPEIMGELRRQGVNVSRDVMELYKALPDVFVPEPVLEYLKWMRAPADVNSAWGATLGLFDGLHALAKGMATISSLAHIGMNFTGNYASIAQKIGSDLFNPAHHYNTWIVMASDSFPQLNNKIINVGADKMTVAQLKKRMAEAGIDESPRTLAYLDEALGGERAGGKAPLKTMLLGSGMGATGGWIAGSAIAGPLGGAAGGFLGSWVGALGGEIAGKSWRKVVDPRTGQRVSRPLSGMEFDISKGIKDVSHTEVGKFIESIEKFKAGKPKELVQQFGESVVGMGAAGVIGSSMGVGAAAVSAAIGKLSFPSYMKMMSALNQSVEIQARRLLGIAQMSRGKTVDEAAFAVQDTMRNYAHLTPFERNVLRRVFFFYTWDAGNIRFQLNQLVKYPRQAAIFNQFMAGIYNGQFTESEISSLPEYLRWRAIFRVGGSKIFSLSGLPQQAAIELSRGISTRGGVPVGLISRGRPDALLLYETIFGGKESVYYGKGWEELNNVRQLKNAPPFLKWLAGYPSQPVSVPVWKNGRPAGKRMDYRSTKPENFYVMSKVPGWRLMNEYMKLATDTFMSRALDYGDPSAEATTQEKMLAYSIGVKPYFVDFDSQREWMADQLIRELQRRWDLHNKNFIGQRTFMNKRWDYERGQFLHPGDRLDEEERQEYDRLRESED